MEVRSPAFQALSSLLNLGKFPPLSEPQFLHLYNGYTLRTLRALTSQVTVLMPGTCVLLPGPRAAEMQGGTGSVGEPDVVATGLPSE